MAISFVAAGAVATAASGDVVPGLPSGWAADDIHLCYVAAADDVNVTFPVGWHVIDPGTTNRGSPAAFEFGAGQFGITHLGGGLRTTLYWRRAEAGDTAPTVTHQGGAQVVAQIVGYRGCSTGGQGFGFGGGRLSVTPFGPGVISVKRSDDSAFAFGSAQLSIDKFGSGLTTVNPASTTVTANGITTVYDNSVVVFFGATAVQATFSSYSGAPTPTERADQPNTAQHPSLFIADFPVAAAGATGDRTCTATAEGVSNGQLIALQPQTFATTKTQSGKASIVVTATQTQAGKARVQVTTPRTQAGVARVRTTATQTQTAKSAVRNTTTQTQPGIADIRKTVTQDITAVASIEPAPAAVLLTVTSYGGGDRMPKSGRRRHRSIF